MARKTRLVDLSPAPASEEEGSENDAAAQQLYAESQLATPAKAQRVPGKSAVVNANLLNAARRTPTAAAAASSPPQPNAHSKGTRTGQEDMAKKKKGLSRPSFMRADLAPPKQDLARQDVYDFPKSPEKDSQGSPIHKLTQKVNKKPLKKVKKGKKAQVEEEEVNAPGTAGIAVPQPIDAGGNGWLFVPHEEHFHPPTSSPPPTAPTIESLHADPAEPSKRRSGRLAGETVGLADVAGSRSNKTKRKADNQQTEIQRAQKSPRRRVRTTSRQLSTEPHVNGGGTLRPFPARSGPIVLIESKRPKPSKAAPATYAKGKGIVMPPSAEDQAALAVENESDDVLESDLPEEDGTVAAPVQASKPKTSSRNAGGRRAAPDGETVVPDVNTRRIRSTAQVSATGLAVRPKQGRGRPQREAQRMAEGTEDAEEYDPQDVSGSDHAGITDDQVGVETRPVDEEADPEEEEQQDQEEEEEDEIEEPTDAINKVFKFLDSEARSGRCRTAEGLNLAQACNAARKTISMTEMTHDEVSLISKDIRALLKSYGGDPCKTPLKKLKVDAYGWLFRHLAQYLEVLYDWLSQQYGIIEESLAAMRIISPFIQDILAFKDSIADWKVPIPPRYQGDRLVKDVETNFIAPLRVVNEDYRALLSQLKDDAKCKMEHEELTRRRKERFEVEARKAEWEALKREKQKRWQDLHVWRMECEHPHLRNLRDHLRYDGELFDKLIEQAEETDANGTRIERVPVFKRRESPPRRIVSTIEPEWTDEQLSALIEGLERYAGPNVFYHIFKNYCRPGRPLRRFTVPEITAKAASMRFDLLDSYRGEGWQIPDWIKRIPVLP
ncbi:hypothetical protein CC80DRAFT_494903 [Byssothecium circinans]|uniref:Uncharacterized protein n=1 Tax=Byssothecium circinans TaxID=147558 RepID=A0A6A5TJH1_9PLEO|nr:hypothetical protein CC80DRAFT_494903 [Byssothecium circinans]